MIFHFFTFGFISCAAVTDDISLTENVGKAYQSMREIPEPVALETEIIGSVPNWLFGSFYRNGPGKFEFGNDTFGHLFDPSAMIQRIHFENGKVTYQRKLVKSSHTLLNLKEERIVFAEMGTWTEPANADEIQPEDISKVQIWKNIIQNNSKGWSGNFGVFQNFFEKNCSKGFIYC